MTLVASVLYLWARVGFVVVRFVWREAKAQSAAWADYMQTAKTG